jgi:predicted dehydrogenase
MLRMRLLSSGAATDRLLPARLRDVAVEFASPTATGAEDQGDCDAVGFFGGPCPAEPIVSQLLRNGKHVLVAGVPAWPWELFAALLEIGDQSGARLEVQNPDRFLPSRRLIREQIPGKLGNAALIRIHRWEPAVETSHQAGQPPVPDVVARDIDLALWLADRPPNCVFAVEHQSPQTNNNAGRFLQLHLGFSDGMALIDYSSRLPPGGGYGSLSVIGTKGSAQADDHQNMQLVFRGCAPRAVRTEEKVDAQARLIRHFAEALRDGRDPQEDAAGWRRVNSAVAAAIQSLSTGQAVTPEDC